MTMHLTVSCTAVKLNVKISFKLTPKEVTAELPSHLVENYSTFPSKITSG